MSSVPEQEEQARISFSVYHISEAIGELSDILTSIAIGNQDFNFERLSTKMAHAYQHLNWFWNGRNRSGTISTDLTATEFFDFSSFPIDLIDEMARGDDPEEGEQGG